MKNKQNGFIGILVVVIIAFGIIGGGTYFYNQNDSKNKIDVSAETTVSEKTNEDISEVLSGTSSQENDNDKANMAVKSEITVTATVPVESKTKTQKIAANAIISSVMNLLMAEADLARIDERGFDKIDGYKTVCKVGVLNEEVIDSTSIKNLLNAQGVTTQSEAKIKCVATKDSYAIEIIPSPSIVNNNVNSYCISGKANSYTGITKIENLRIDTATYTCK